jgi:hypothetical protein
MEWLKSHERRHFQANDKAQKPRARSPFESVEIYSFFSTFWAFENETAQPQQG